MLGELGKYNQKDKQLSSENTCLKIYVDRVNVTNFNKIHHTLHAVLSESRWKPIGQIGRAPAHCFRADWSPVAPGALSPL